MVDRWSTVNVHKSDRGRSALWD